MNAKRLISGRPWAIREPVFDAIRVAADKDLTAQGVLDMMPPDASLLHDQSGCHVIDVSGVIVKSKSALDTMLGGVVSLDDLGAAFDTALSQPARAIIFNFDSPGGTVSGVPEFASRLYEARQQSSMPLVAVCAGGCVCSAAY